MPAAHRRALTRALIRHQKMIGQHRAPRKLLPRQHYPSQIENAYARALSTKVAGLIRGAFAPLMHALPGFLYRARATRRLDAQRGDIGEGAEARALIAGARDRLAAGINAFDIEDIAGRFAVQTAAYQRTQLDRQTEAGLGVKLSTFGPDRTEHHIVEAFVDSNVSLIRGLGDKVAADVSSAVFRGIQDGKAFVDIAPDLEDRFAFGDRRSMLIARDQVGKLYGQINMHRQKQLGVEQFVWRTAGDDRVRDEHDARDGETFDYDDPPDGELPGEPVLCRCWAEPVFDDDFSDEESDDSDDEDTSSDTPVQAPDEPGVADVPGLNAALEPTEDDSTGIGFGRIGVSGVETEITGEAAAPLTGEETPFSPLGGRIGVTPDDEIGAAALTDPFRGARIGVLVGESVETVAVATAPAFVETSAAPLVAEAVATATKNVLLPSTDTAPLGYAAYTYNGDKYLQHAVAGGVYLTPEQLVAYNAGDTVILDGPNRQFPGFDALARKDAGTRYQFQEWIGSQKPMFTVTDIESGKANEDILWLIEHEHAKPSLRDKVASLFRMSK